MPTPKELFELPETSERRANPEEERYAAQIEAQRRKIRDLTSNIIRYTQYFREDYKSRADQESVRNLVDLNRDRLKKSMERLESEVDEALSELSLAPESLLKAIDTMKGALSRLEEARNEVLQNYERMLKLPAEPIQPEILAKSSLPKWVQKLKDYPVVGQVINRYMQQEAEQKKQEKIIDTSVNPAEQKRVIAGVDKKADTFLKVIQGLDVVPEKERAAYLKKYLSSNQDLAPNELLRQVNAEVTRKTRDANRFLKNNSDALEDAPGVASYERHNDEIDQANKKIAELRKDEVMLVKDKAEQIQQEQRTISNALDRQEAFLQDKLSDYQNRLALLEQDEKSAQEQGLAASSSFNEKASYKKMIEGLKQALSAVDTRRRHLQLSQAQYKESSWTLAVNALAKAYQLKDQLPEARDKKHFSELIAIVENAASKGNENNLERARYDLDRVMELYQELAGLPVTDVLRRSGVRKKIAALYEGHISSTSDDKIEHEAGIDYLEDPDLYRKHISERMNKALGNDLNNQPPRLKELVAQVNRYMKEFVLSDTVVKRYKAFDKIEELMDQLGTAGRFEHSAESTKNPDQLKQVAQEFLQKSIREVLGTDTEQKNLPEHIQQLIAQLDAGLEYAQKPKEGSYENLLKTTYLSLLEEKFAEIRSALEHYKVYRKYEQEPVLLQQEYSKKLSGILKARFGESMDDADLPEDIKPLLNKTREIIDQFSKASSKERSRLLQGQLLKDLDLNIGLLRSKASESLPDEIQRYAKNPETLKDEITSRLDSILVDTPDPLPETVTKIRENIEKDLLKFSNAKLIERTRMLKSKLLNDLNYNLTLIESLVSDLPKETGSSGSEADTSSTGTGEVSGEAPDAAHEPASSKPETPEWKEDQERLWGEYQDLKKSLSNGDKKPDQEAVKNRIQLIGISAGEKAYEAIKNRGELLAHIAKIEALLQETEQRLAENEEIRRTINPLAKLLVQHNILPKERSRREHALDEAAYNLLSSPTVTEALKRDFLNAAVKTVNDALKSEKKDPAEFYREIDKIADEWGIREKTKKESPKGDRPEGKPPISVTVKKLEKASDVTGVSEKTRLRAWSLMQEADSKLSKDQVRSIMHGYAALNRELAYALNKAATEEEKKKARQEAEQDMVVFINKVQSLIETPASASKPDKTKEQSDSFKAIAKDIERLNKKDFDQFNRSRSGTVYHIRQLLGLEIGPSSPGYGEGKREPIPTLSATELQTLKESLVSREREIEQSGRETEANAEKDVQKQWQQLVEQGRNTAASRKENGEYINAALNGFQDEFDQLETPAEKRDKLTELQTYIESLREPTPEELQLELNQAWESLLKKLPKEIDKRAIRAQKTLIEAISPKIPNALSLGDKEKGSLLLQIRRLAAGKKGRINNADIPKELLAEIQQISSLLV